MNDGWPRTQPLPADFAAVLAQSARRLGLFARQILWYPQLTSTNDLAARLAEQGAREGCVIIADAQIAGRGRLGRPWCSPRGAGLYVSVILRPASHVLPLLTIAAGVALAEGIRISTGLHTVLKWPNDVSVSGRKLAGILTEARTDPSGGSFVILGFGINVRPSAYPPDVAARATSIEGELDRPIERGEVLTECLAALAHRYEDLDRRHTAAVLAAWRSYAMPMMGREVEWTGRHGTERGFAHDVDETGALVVRCAYGMTRVISGEVRWV
jgi:BirA family biotin operon repressor/biotin-[acetyl-CoA-carboxylase] ligase